MLNYFATYLCIGTVLMLILEIFIKRDKDYEEITNIDRIIGILGWPMFLNRYLKRVWEILRNKDDE